MVDNLQGNVVGVNRSNAQCSDGKGGSEMNESVVPIQEGFEEGPSADDQIRPLLSQSAAKAEPSSSHLSTVILPSTYNCGLNLEVEGCVDPTRVLRKVNWHLLPIFFLLAIMCSIDRANLSFAAPQLNADLGFSSSVYGFGSGIFFVGYALFAIPSTMVCASIGAPRLLGSILIVWGLVASLFAFMSREWQFLVLRFILGLAESGAYPGMWYHLALFYSERELGVAYSIVSTASSLSGVVGGPIAAALLKLDGCLGLRGWQWLFLLEGIPAALLGIVVIYFLADSPSTASYLCPEEQHWLATRQQAFAQEQSSKMANGEGVKCEGRKTGILESIVFMLREWRIWYLGAIWSTVCMGIDGLVFWIPLLIWAILYGEGNGEDTFVDEDAKRKALGERVVHTALLSSIPFASAAIGMVVVAFIAKRTGERHWTIAGPLLLGSAALLGLALVQDKVPQLSLGLLTLGAVGIWGPHGPLLSWPAALLPSSSAASGFALIKSLGAFAAFASNAAIGELHEHTGSFVAPIVMLACLLAVGAGLVLGFREPGQGDRLDVKPMLNRLRDRIGVKRSRSDPASCYPARTFSGSLSTIHQGVALPHPASGRDEFQMPDLQAALELRGHFGSQQGTH